MSAKFPWKIVSEPSSTAPAPSPSEIHATKKRQQQQQQQQRLRSPLHLLNDTSADAPTGCLRFFLSHSSSSSKTPPNNTPKSTPSLTLRPLKENVPKQSPRSRKFQGLYKCQPRKKTSSTATKNPKILSCANSVHNPDHSLVRMVDHKSHPAQRNWFSSNLNFTPLRKLEMGTCSNETVDKVEEENPHSGKSKTPPIQASISPEIQCGSSVVSKVTPVCYGAGYLVSGVSDKRKCRPRGILIVGENNSCLSRVRALENEDNYDSIVRDTTDSVISKVPSPIEASMNWLLSPFNEEDPKENSENASLLSIHPLSPDINNHSSVQKVGNHRKNSTLFISPSKHSSPVCTPPNCMDVILEERRKQRYQLNGENSPFSMDSLDSDNVIRTPQSDSSSAQKVSLPWITTESIENDDLNSVSELLSLTNVTPESPKPTVSSTDLSFQFDCLAAISNSMDVNQFQKILEDQAYWNSYSSSSEDMLESQMRVSWREGLMSRIYEMDEFDSCRCLSDEEEAVDSHSIDLSDILETHLEHNDCGVDPKLVNDKSEAFEMFCPGITCSCAESISTDGGGLVASADSDWNLCYKNRLFDF